MTKQNVSNLPPGQINMIGQGTVIDGTLESKSDVRIGGKIMGKLVVEGKVVITPEGEIEGEIVATNADIAGTVHGEIVVKERAVLKNSAVIEGNIRTSKLVIEDGAVFTGKCDMSKKPAPEPVIHRRGAERPNNAPPVLPVKQSP